MKIYNLQYTEYYWTQWTEHQSFFDGQRGPSLAAASPHASRLEGVLTASPRRGRRFTTSFPGADHSVG
jgi:hypothetical protein